MDLWPDGIGLRRRRAFTGQGSADPKLKAIRNDHELLEKPEFGQWAVNSLVIPLTAKAYVQLLKGQPGNELEIVKRLSRMSSLRRWLMFGEDSLTHDAMYVENYPATSGSGAVITDSGVLTYRSNPHRKTSDYEFLYQGARGTMSDRMPLFLGGSGDSPSEYSQPFAHSDLD